MPVFNENPIDLVKSIESILKQTEKRIELIIILDNPDNQELDNFLENYKINDERIIYLKNKKNLGIGLTLNKGIENSNYDLIARLDADDISLPNRLEIQLDYLIKKPNVTMVSTNCIYIDESDTIVGEKGDIPENGNQIKQLLPYGSTIIHSSVMYRKDAVQKLNGYRQLLNCQDYDLWLRMIDNGYIIESINQRLTQYRLREESITSRKALRSMLTEEYVRSLHKERLESESLSDSFSYSNYLEYLNYKKCNNKDSMDKYYKVSKLYNKGLNFMQEKKIIKASTIIVYCILKDRRVLIRVKNMINYRKQRKKVMSLV
ncbi:MAG: glycosyltransferase [Vagococcus sp.]